jgi:hypothetical protein
MRQIFLKKGHMKSLYIKNQASCDEEVMEEHAREEKNNLDEVKHVEASLSFLPHDVVEVVQPYSPPVHEVQETTILSDKCEDAHASTPPAHKDKEMVTFSDGIVIEPLHMVDENINTFIHTSRRKWDFCHLIFDKDPIYDIEGSP